MSSSGPSNDPILLSRDALRIPVVVRDAPGKRQYRKWRKATHPWPTVDGFPGTGEYLADTTWRDILSAAITVGRDVIPWLVNRPHRAAHELLARVTPLTAYLSREQYQFPHGKRPRLVPSIAYSQGAERSAQGAFAYRLGMTMAEWSCRNLMGLGSTTHAESTPPPGALGWPGLAGTPDLFGIHPVEQRLWLVEAKAARWIGLPQLRRGSDQLLAGGTLVKGVPHRLVLCGSSVEEEVFMTVDTIATGGPELWPEQLPNAPVPPPRPQGQENLTDPVALAEFARSQMLLYFLLSSVEPNQLTVVPAARHRSSTPGRSYSSLSLLERDSFTRQVRGQLRQEPPTDTRDLMSRKNVEDLLTVPLPGTGIRVGLSRGLFAACGRLHQELASIVEETQGSVPMPRTLGRPRLPDRVPEDHDSDERRADIEAWSRRVHALEKQRAGEVRLIVREAYDSGQERSWRQLLGAEPALDVDGGGLLEAVGRGTYLAIDARTPVLDPRDG